MIATRQMAREHYNRSVAKAQVHDLWARLRSKERNLIRFDDVAQRLGTHQRVPRGIQTVPLDKIVGSVGRYRDFNRSFLPRPWVSRDRWAGIDAALNALVPLPPVDLIQVGDVYFVADGNHRISVFRANGLLEIDADVTELASSVSLTVNDIRQGTWKDENPKEETMFDTPDMVRQDYKERLQEAAQERRVSQIMAARPSRWRLLLAKVGDLLISAGTRLEPDGRVALT